MHPIDEERIHGEPRGSFSNAGGSISGLFGRDPFSSRPGPLGHQRRYSSGGAGGININAPNARNRQTSMTSAVEEGDDEMSTSPIARRLSLGARAMGGFMRRPSVSGSPQSAASSSMSTSPTAAPPSREVSFADDPFRRAPEQPFRPRRHSMATTVPKPDRAKPPKADLLHRPPSPTSERILAGDFTHGF